MRTIIKKGKVYQVVTAKNNAGHPINIFIEKGPAV